ncbi:docking protein 1 isoform X1 [Denticeps clupeoides]|uniref:docking protein 1 isoform X1 n=2 Tax=Denticeps clupeoides TaxID=299321 RepID=UPI0010A49DE6|nr:docking protein 1-like isoform X1 [Denticeps clupeoides]
MDTHVKRGEVYLQSKKHCEKWKRLWLVLYPASRRGVARLEMLDADGGDKLSVVRSRHPEKRVVRLADCVSVVQVPPHAEACPKDNMAIFCVETEDRRLVFATERESCSDWVQKVCLIAFPVSSGDVQQKGLKMEENQIYASIREVSEFRVNIQPTEASARCSLRGMFWLEAGKDALLLRDPENRRCLLEWPYHLLRRYGRDKMMFSIEAGRRCESGPGSFTFETRQGDDIFRLIESAVKEQKFRSMPGNGSRSPSPLPNKHRISDLMEPPRNSISDFGSTECLYSDSMDSGRPGLSHPVDDSVEIVYSEPIDAVKLPHTAKRDNSPALSSTNPYDYPESQYSHPVDCLCSYPDANDPTYADPIDLLKPPVPITSHPNDVCEPIYSEVLDHGSVPHKAARPNSSHQERFYSEPQVGACSDLPGNYENKQGFGKGDVLRQEEDDPSSLYSQVNKPSKASKGLGKISPKLSRARRKIPADRHHYEPDNVYEELGI